jgi:hypothetical protein
MTPDELQQLVDDHYRGESQTLTTAAEQNLLKLGELRGRLTAETGKRWSEMKSEFVRQRRMGGNEADPVTKLVGTLSGLGAELDAIKQAIAAGKQTELAAELKQLRGVVSLAASKPPPAPPAQESAEAWLGPRLDSLAAWLAESQQSRRGNGGDGELQHWLAPKLDAIAESLRGHAGSIATPRLGTDPGSLDPEALLAQIRRIEDSLMPVVGAAVESRAGDTLLANKMVQIIDLLKHLNARLGNGS